MKWLRTGSGYILMGVLALTYGFVLAILDKNLMGYATIIGASVAFVSAGGAVKAAFEARNNKTAGPPHTPGA